MANNLTVKITADEVDLRTRLALAQASMRAFNAETKSLADQVREAGGAANSNLTPQLEAAARSAAQAKTEIAALNSELKEQKFSSMGTLRSSIEELGAPIRNVTSLVATLGEAFAITFGAERILGSIEKVAELGEQLEKASKITGVSVSVLSGWRYGAQQVGVSAEALNTALMRLGRNMQTAISQPTGAAAKSFELMGISQEFLRVNSNNLQAVLMKMSDSFHAHAEGGQAEALAMATMGRSAAEMLPWLQQGSDKIQEWTDRQRALGANMSQDMAAAMEKHRQAVIDLDTAWTGLMLKLDPAIRTLTNLFSVLAQSTAGNFNAALIIDYTFQATKLTNQLDELKKKAAGESGLSRWWDDRQIKGLEFQIDIVTKKLDELKLKAQDQTGKPFALAPAPNSNVPDKKPEFGNLPDLSGASTALEAFRTNLAQMQADWTGTRRGMLAESVAMWQEELRNATLTEKEIVAAQKGEADARRALNQQIQQETSAINRSDVDTDLKIARMKIDAEKSGLDISLQNNQITADQKLQILRDLTNQEFDLNLKALQDEMALLALQPVEYERVYNQIRELKAKNVQDLAALDRQASLDAKKQADEQAAGWKDAVREMTSAESGFVANIFSGRQTLTQSLMQMTSQLVQHEIAEDLKYLTVKALYGVLQLQADQKTATGGLLIHLLGETRKTAATVTGETSRTAITTVGETQRQAVMDTGFFSFITRIGTQLAEWLGFETSKTAITGAGEAAGLAIQASSADASITTDAAVAAAGSYASAAPIPYIGWIIGAGAAAAALTAVLAYKSSVSAEGGMLTVPADGTLIKAHKNESVLPAGIAGSMRDFFANGGGGQGGGGDINVNFHVSALDGPSVKKMLLANSDVIASSIAGSIRNSNSSLRNALRA